MSRTEHITRMIIGWLLYWLIGRLMPAAWWCTRRGWFRWALPHMGYYAYHEGPWSEPLDGRAHDDFPEART